MKGRTIPLQDAHKTSNNNEEEESSSSSPVIIWDWQAKHLITGGPDKTILIHRYPLHPSSSSSSSSPSPLPLRHHKNSVTALAINPNAKTLASASADHSVKLYSYPGGDFQSNVTRFTLPIRSLAFNRSGQLLAAGGDDDGIKLISTIDNAIVRVLKSHNGSVLCLAFDPKDEYLVSVDSEGSVIFWELSSGKVVHNMKRIGPSRNCEIGCPNYISWSPDGEMVAVPGHKGEVVMYDRDTAEKVFSLKGGHSGVVNGLAWSPNGKYIATCGSDRVVLIWDCAKKQDIDRQKTETLVWSLAWKPTDNALAVVDDLGRFGVWESPIASHMVSPTEGTVKAEDEDGEDDELFMGRYREDEVGIDVGEEEDGVSVGGSLDGIGDESDDDMCRIPRRVKAKAKSSDVKVEKDCEVSDVMDSKSNRVVKVRGNVMPMQEAFQPGATPKQFGKRNFLAYNLIGCAVTFENDGVSHIEVEFHDIGRSSRVPSMSDYFGHTMASLNESGAVFASPQKGEKNPSILMYRPFSSWANNSEWSMRFPMGEEVRVVALGAGWIAALTSLNFLRIFSEGGLQRFVLSLDGPVVTAAGHGDLLFVVSHSSNPLPSGEQVLSFTVFNISEKTRPLTGHLPISPCSHLTWIGFTEEGLLSSYDSEGTLRVFTNEYSGCWVPLLSMNTMSERKSEAENYWMVGLNKTQAFCVICKSPEKYPQVVPKPILSVFDLKLPLACSDLGADDLENEYIRDSLLLSQIQKKLEEAVKCDKDCHAEEDDITKLEASLDRCLLRLISNCYKGDKLVRAVELAKQLSLQKSLQAAITLASAMKLPMLAERLNGILEDKMHQEEMETLTSLKSMSDMYHKVEDFSRMNSHQAPVKDISRKVTPIKSEDDNGDLAFSESDSKRAESLATQTKETVFSAQKKMVSSAEKEMVSSAQNDNTAKESTGGQSDFTNHKPSNPFAKGVFAKSSGKQKGDSLLNSLKKMQDNASEKDAKRKERTGSNPQKPSKKSKKTA